MKRLLQPELLPHQLAACCRTMPAFAKAYADVERMKADVAKNRAQFEKPAEPVNVFTLSRKAAP